MEMKVGRETKKGIKTSEVGHYITYKITCINIDRFYSLRTWHRTGDLQFKRSPWHSDDNLSDIQGSNVLL